MEIGEKTWKKFWGRLQNLRKNWRIFKGKIRKILETVKLEKYQKENWSFGEKQRNIIFGKNQRNGKRGPIQRNFGGKLQKLYMKIKPVFGEKLRNIVTEGVKIRKIFVKNKHFLKKKVEKF